MAKPFLHFHASYHSQILPFLLFVILATSAWPSIMASSPQQELVLGFEAKPDNSISSFQPILDDSTGNFSFGFFRTNRTQLTLSVIHLPSLEILWHTNPGNPILWSDRTQLIFNGSLVIFDEHKRLVWSTGTHGDKVILLNSSNLQVQKVGPTNSVLWQSFDFPTDTLVESQNLTSAMALVSLNGKYSMRLGNNFIGLYAKFKEGNLDQIYWRHKALEAKAEIVDGQGPIIARISPNGFLGMYQDSDKPADVQPFNSFQRPMNDSFLFIRLEPDGNLRGYLWDGNQWVLDYQAIDDTCELASSCGPYGLCRPGSGCSCLDNRTEFGLDECVTVWPGDFCGSKNNGFSVLRRKGVELPYKELMGYKTASSLEECEGFCEYNCTCWGAVYNNASGFCYLIDYPIQTQLSVSDESKAGYFKVKVAENKKTNVGFWYGLLGLAMLVLIGVVGFGSYIIWRRRRGVKSMFEEDGGISPGPYKDLGSASFRSIEMCNSNR